MGHGEVGLRGWVLSFTGGLSCVIVFFSISMDTLTSCNSRVVLARRQLGQRKSSSSCFYEGFKARQGEPNTLTVKPSVTLSFTVNSIVTASLTRAFCNDFLTNWTFNVECFVFQFF